MLLIPSFARPLLDQFAPVFFQPTYQRFLVLLVAADPDHRPPHRLQPAPHRRRLGPRRSLQLSPRPLQTALVLAPTWRASWPGSSSIIASPRGPSSWPATIPSTSTAAPRSTARAVTATRCARPIPTPPIRWGHKWVVLAILVQFPFATRPWALPVLVALYRSPEKAAKAEAPAARPRPRRPRTRPRPRPSERARRKVRKAAGRRQRRHKTPSELMRQLLAVLIHWFPDRQFVFAGDGGYGTHALARFAHRHRRHLDAW